MAGVSEEAAMKAATSVVSSDISQLVTKADMKAELSAMKAELSVMEARIIRWNTATLLAATALFAAIVKLA